MIKVHVISDLDLGHNEFCDPVDETIPDVDLVIINGNIGHAKRSALYAETLSLKYPNIQFVWNLGELERYWQVMDKFTGEMENNIKIRKASNPKWPKNLHWCHDDSMIIDLKNGESVDIFCTYGFPKIVSYNGDWKETNWYKNYVAEWTYDINKFVEKPKTSSNVSHGIVPIWATQDWVNSKHEEVEKKIKKWELNVTTFKILVTHINPYKDNRLINQTTSPYLIHLNNMLWVTSNTVVDNVNYLGANLYANPGRGAEIRSKVIQVN